MLQDQLEWTRRTPISELLPGPNDKTVGPASLIERRHINPAKPGAHSEVPSFKTQPASLDTR